MNVLCLSDVIEPTIYSPTIRKRFNKVDVVIGCGDLPYYYQEFAATMLDAALFYVRGNHDKPVEHSTSGERHGPLGGQDLHRRSICHDKVLIAGIEGSLRYRPGPFQYTQAEMWQHAFILVPALFRNKMVHGRYLDVLVTHAPPRGIHDKDDLPHQGINAFLWILKVFQPAYHLHGHIHLYRPDETNHSVYGETRVINTFGFKEISL